MDLESATRELYRLAPAQFTAARDAMAASARQTSHQELASSLKKLRKPSVGAWLANLLVFEQTSDVENLIDLGIELRTPKRKLEGERIRRVSKEKSDAVSKLVQDARSRASREGQAVSAAALLELEATLEAAFADAQAARILLGGPLNRGLQYSGLGFGDEGATGSRTGTQPSASARRSKSEATRTSAERELEHANHELEKADAHLAETRQALAEAAQELSRLKSAEALAVRRAKEAQANVTAAK